MFGLTNVCLFWQMSLNENLHNDEYAASRREVLTHMCSRAMQVKFCSCLSTFKILFLYFCYFAVYFHKMYSKKILLLFFFFCSSILKIFWSNQNYLMLWFCLDGVIFLYWSSERWEFLPSLCSECSSLHTLHFTYTALCWCHSAPSTGCLPLWVSLLLSMVACS